MSVLIPSASHVDMSVRPYDLVVVSYKVLRPVIYWTDSKRNVIVASRLDGSDIGIIIDASAQFKPRHLAVDTCLGSVQQTFLNSNSLQLYVQSFNG